MAAQPNAQTPMITVDSDNSFKLAYDSSSFAVLFFWADWHDSCKQIQLVLEELSNDHKDLKFISIDAEKHDNITTKFGVTAVPTILLLKNKKEFKRLEADTVPNTVSSINQFAKHSKTAKLLKQQKNQFNTNNTNNNNNNNNNNDQTESKEELDKRIAKIISAAPIMLIMKGTPDEPKCKFSRATIKVLKEQNVSKFGYFNILTDPAVRAGIKIYSNWATFPQLYINNKLIGGLDVIKELIDDDEFQSLLPISNNNINDRIKKLIDSNKIMLFMKGTPTEPQCGFSAQIIKILKEQNINNYGYFNILGDNDIRQGIKKYSNWPTFPQLYSNSKLIGGLDVVKEMIDDDEFEDAML